MRTLTSLALVTLASCGGSAKPAAKPTTPPGKPPSAVTEGATTTATTMAPPLPPLPPPPADFARADLVTLDGGVVTAYAVSADALTRLGSATLTSFDPEDTVGVTGDWADHDHLFARTAEREVVMVTASAVTYVPVPPQAMFATARPTDADNPDDLEANTNTLDAGMGLVLGEGTAWWVECPWGYPYDGWECAVWRTAQLWPSAATQAQDDLPSGTPESWPDTKVAGYKLVVSDDNHRLQCTPPGKRAKATTFVHDGDAAEEIYGWHWVSTSPPRLLVEFGQYGLADLYPTHWELHDGCNAAVLVRGTTADPGPGELWVAQVADHPDSDDTHQVLYRGARPLGDLTGTVHFRPAAK